MATRKILAPSESLLWIPSLFWTPSLPDSLPLPLSITRTLYLSQTFSLPLDSLHIPEFLQDSIPATYSLPASHSLTSDLMGLP